jgi:hypothetical protein
MNASSDVGRARGGWGRWRERWNGGAGANGSNAGPGDGPNTSDCWFGNCRRAGGNGGNGTPGGNGGYGGRAGDGGNGGFLVLAIP